MNREFLSKLSLATMSSPVNTSSVDNGKDDDEHPDTKNPSVVMIINAVRCNLCINPLFEVGI
jgi:hypothetical protein